MISVSSEVTASTMRRAAGGTRSTKKVTPAFSPRASALAAPKKLDPTIRPRATSSDHSTGKLNSERNVTEPITTARSAINRTAAIASVASSRKRSGARVAPAWETAVTCGSGTRALDRLDEVLRFGPLLDEVLGLHGDALAEGILVDVVDRDAALLQHFLRLALDRHPVRAGIGRRLLCGVEERIAQLGV